jgi:hypothetical protein
LAVGCYNYYTIQFWSIIGENLQVLNQTFTPISPVFYGYFALKYYNQSLLFGGCDESSIVKVDLSNPLNYLPQYANQLDNSNLGIFCLEKTSKYYK